MKKKHIAGIFAAAMPFLSGCWNTSPPILATDYPGSATTLPAGRTRPPNLSGTLTKPIAQYTGTEFNDFVRNVALGGGHSRPRACKHFWSCAFDGGKTDVTITATADAMWLNATNAGPNGTVAAIVTGVHHDTDSYPFLKNDTYAFILYPAVAPNGATWSLEQIEKTNGVYSISSVASGSFKECTPGTVLYWTSSSADFAECGSVPHTTPRPTGSTQMDVMGFGALKVVFANLLAVYRDGPPSWFTCETGCCTMDAS